MISKIARVLLPPFWFLAAIGLQIILHTWLPGYRYSSLPMALVGVALMIAGILLVLGAARAFRSAGTPIKPFSPSTSLIRSGAYRFTRNPMYLGMLSMLCGSSLALQSVSTLSVIPLFFILIDRGYVEGEETFLLGVFGEEYRELQRSVPRWLGWKSE